MSTFYRRIVLALLLLRICHCQKHTNGVFIQADSAPFAYVFLHLFFFVNFVPFQLTLACAFFLADHQYCARPRLTWVVSGSHSGLMNAGAPRIITRGCIPPALFWRGRPTGRWKRGGPTMGTHAEITRWHLTEMELDLHSWSWAQWVVVRCEWNFMGWLYVRQKLDCAFLRSQRAEVWLFASHFLRNA